MIKKAEVGRRPWAFVVCNAWSLVLYIMLINFLAFVGQYRSSQWLESFMTHIRTYVPKIHLHSFLILFRLFLSYTLHEEKDFFNKPGCYIRENVTVIQDVHSAIAGMKV